MIINAVFPHRLDGIWSDSLDRRMMKQQSQLLISYTQLATRKESPFYISIDLTGEQKDVSIKQGSLAPEIKTLVSRSKRKHNPTLEEYLTLLIRFFAAIRSLDPQGWGDPTSTYYKARVLRALVRLLVDIVAEARSFTEVTAESLLQKLQKIDPTTLSDERVRAAQGSAGVMDLYTEIKKQVFRRHATF